MHVCVCMVKFCGGWAEEYLTFGKQLEARV